MKIIVNPHKIEIIKNPVNEKEINITKCEFEFSEEIGVELVKKAFFTLNDGTTYEQIIVNNECNYPSEAIQSTGQVEIGVIAYEVQSEEYIKRFNPSPAYFEVIKGSLRNAQNSSKPTPSQIEQIESEIAEIQAEQITQNESIETLNTNKQDKLISGTNIKTINSNSLLGNGNINLNDTYYTENEIDTKLELKADKSEIPDDYITKDVNDLTYYTLATNTGSTIELSINTSTYVMTLNLKNSMGTIISTGNVDLPLESVVVNGIYDDNTKKIILTLQNGNTIEFSVADLVSGLQSEITSSNKLSSDLVDDTNNTNKFVTTSEKSTWNNKYNKPNDGIPKTDLASDVQTSLGKADTAIQDISGKLDTSKVKNETSSSAGDVYDVRYINTMIGDIETLLEAI